MKWCYLFSGQGAQKAGYLSDAISKYDYLTDNIKVAEKITGYPLEMIFKFGPQEILNQTIFTQLFLYIYGTTLADLIEKQTNFRPSYLAGLSVGEYTACCYSGVFSYEEGIKLVFHRANLMHKSCIVKKGTMFALIGADIELVKNFCSKLSRYGIIEIANYNADNQVVIGCEQHLKEKVLREYRDSGIKKAIELKVEGAFHTSLMEYANQNLSYYLDKIKLNHPRIPIISNVTARDEIEPEEIRENLKKQTTSYVRWYESILYLKGKDVTNFVELGPGGVLSDLVKRTHPDAKVYKIDNLIDLENLIDSIKALSGL
ncbi:MAG: ACP S-malonyltransferase [Planctomycetota bacterium]